MTIRDQFIILLPLLGFKKIHSKWIKVYSQHADYTISVDISNGIINYPKPMDVCDSTTANFAHSENLVVIECINRLLEKGYKPESIILEKKWTLGKTAKGGKADITITDLEKKVLFIIECKTWGAEYIKEKRKMQTNGGQLFSYLRQDRNCRYLCLYASCIEYNEVKYENGIVRTTDDSILIDQFDSGDEEIKLFREAKNEDELVAAWRESYACYFHPNGIFDDESRAYAVELKPLKIKDLRPLSADDGKFIYSQFAEILRHSNISDRENAFNKMISLFLVKVVDENKGENEVVDFQWKEGQDTYEELQDRLQKLYKTGMRDYLKEEVIYFENSYVNEAFSRHKRAYAKDQMLAMLKALKFYTNNEFAFKEVHNERLFELNAKVLNEVVQLLQPYKIKYSQRTQFLGNLFELLLNTGVKQSEGQFFTPIPIAAFMVSCLPFDEIVRDRIANGEVHKLPKVIDFACGSGHFLTEAIDDIQKAGENNLLAEAIDTRWTRDYVFGIERDYRLARVSKIACFMNGSGDTNVIFGDGLENHIALGAPGTFDALLANPPYAIKDFKEHLHLKNNHFDLSEFLTDTSSEIEALFVERIYQLLKPGGIAAVILPSSILSNPGIYTKAREIILKYFDIKAIAEFGGNTFSSTSTNTVALFLQRHSNGNFVHHSYRADSIFDEGKVLDSDFEDETLLKSYVEQTDTPYDEYMTLLAVDEDGRRHLSAAFKASELYVAYMQSFQQLPEIVKLKENKVFTAKSADERSKLLNHRFLSYILSYEKNKFVYFCLTLNQKVVIVKSGTKEREKEFLGYEWTNRRGFQGMIPIGKGKLYDKENVFNPNTAACYIRKNYLNQPLDSLPESMEAHISVQQLSDMLEFSHVGCDLKILVDTKAKLPLSTKFSSIRFDKVASLEYGKALAGKLRIAGSVPVYGSNGKSGTHNTALVQGPGIVVGRKGSAGKVNFAAGPFWPIDTTYWVKFDPTKLDINFLYWLLMWLDLTVLVGRKGVGVPGLSRVDVHRSLIPDVPLPVQKATVKKIMLVSETLANCLEQRMAIMDKLLS